MCKLTRGDRFKDARLVHNKNGKQTMDEVYAATGIAASMIKDLEDDNKYRSVGYDKIATLAKHYGVSADYLLSLTNDPAQKPCATDELGLSANVINWISTQTNSLDGHRIQKQLSTLFEMDCFQAFIYTLRDYLSALEAASIAGNIMRDFNSGSPVLYPDSKTYMEKLKAASKDSQYDKTTQLYLSCYLGFEKAFFNSTMGVVLDMADGGGSHIHMLDIAELNVKRSLNDLLHAIENDYE